MDSQFLLTGLVNLVPLLLSLTVHEFAHAWSAWRLGDDTAERLGRLTLNPIAHIDPIGTLLLPMLGIPFGWAKPVPVNPARFRREVPMRTGMMLTAAAGPLSNLVLALLGAVAFGLLQRWAPDFLDGNPGLYRLLVIMVVMNVGLALFNLLPIPPLDGSRVVEGLLPTRFQGAWEQVLRLGPVLLLVTIYFGARWIREPAQQLGRWLFSLSGWLAG